MSTTVPPGKTSAVVPGPAGSPLLGSMLELRRGALDLFLDARRDYGDLVRFTAGPPGLRKEIYAVFSAEGAQQVLATEATNFRKDSRFYQEVRETAGNNLLTSQDAIYQRQRRLLQPLFTQRRVDSYAAEIAEETQALLTAWDNAPDDTVELVEDMSRLTQRITVRILFGADFEAALDVVARCFPVIGDYIQRRSYSFVSVPRTWPTPMNRRAAAATEELYAVCDRVIGKRRAEADTSAAEDMITLLVQAQNAEDGKLDAAETRDQALVFLLAGTETTSTSLAMALHLLARHPEAQERAREEARRVLGTRAPVSSDMDELRYLSWVVKESMRLYPAGAFVTRNAVAATEIDGYTIPAGAEVLVSPWVTQRHPRYWDEPERFDPERFTPEREKARHRYAWFPFGGGPRACIGKHLAMLEAVTALAMILRQYELDAVDEHVPVTYGVTLRTETPVRCRLRPA
ncbi:cytochrome P450 [Streptomyces sp. NK08204]|uniref:cytochrome P450 n=1 Tax=Streptomyces sp. NK08204 TaxID=2873260 RepID=UPI001CED0CD3|nr:cytochrome P450 [Streptomyces sp. NK08204]